jgi:hypothetical protein
MPALASTTGFSVEVDAASVKMLESKDVKPVLRLSGY